MGTGRRDVPPELVAKMWSEGERRQVIADRLGVHRSTVDERLRAAGVEPKSIPERKRR